MGARLKVREITSRWQMGDRKWIDPVNYAVDIRRDRYGAFFELRVPTHLSETVEATVLQSEPKQRHLLLLIRKTDEKPQLDRFLCGHDERNWFVAAVPGGASSVRQAMDALQPKDVRDALARDRVSSRKRYERKNRAFRRQGEWFFVPEPSLVWTRSLFSVTSRSVVVRANRISWSSSSAPAARRSTFARSIRTAFPKRNTPSCSA